MGCRQLATHLFAVLVSLLLYSYHRKTPNPTPAKPPPDPASSIWCRGSLCRFRNLCLNPTAGEFLFLHGPTSVVSGVRARQHTLTVADLSPVADHNAMGLNLVDVPLEMLGELGLPVRTVDVGVGLVMKRFKPNNLMHVVHDDLMPVLEMMREVGGDGGVRLVLADRLPRGPYWELYGLFGEGEPVVMGEMEEGIVCLKDVYVGLPTTTIWYQYGFLTPQGPWPNRTVTRTEIDRFTEYVSTALKTHIIPWECPADISLAVLLVRKNTRLILNEDEVADIIHQETNSHVEKLSLDDHSVVDIIAHVRCAKILVGMHGALLVLAAFLRPSTILIELFPYAIPPQDYTPYKTLVNLPGMGVVYAAWRNALPENTFTHPGRAKEQGGIAHLPPELQLDVMEKTEIEPHLCCHDPYWLFRIYQDTWVDEESFREVVRKAVEEKEKSKEKWEKETEEIRVRNVLPGKVQNLTCTVKAEKVSVSWTEPWNLQFIKGKGDEEYEVITQKQGESGYNRYLTKGFKLQLRTACCVKNVWVKCMLKGRVGAVVWAVCKQFV